MCCELESGLYFKGLTEAEIIARQSNREAEASADNLMEQLEQAHEYVADLLEQIEDLSREIARLRGHGS